jgi:hypothetical protein
MSIPINQLVWAGTWNPSIFYPQYQFVESPINSLCYVNTNIQPSYGGSDPSVQPSASWVLLNAAQPSVGGVQSVVAGKNISVTSGQNPAVAVTDDVSLTGSLVENTISANTQISCKGVISSDGNINATGSLQSGNVGIFLNGITCQQSPFIMKDGGGTHIASIETDGSVLTPSLVISSSYLGEETLVNGVKKFTVPIVKAGLTPRIFLTPTDAYPLYLSACDTTTYEFTVASTNPLDSSSFSYFIVCDS